MPEPLVHYRNQADYQNELKAQRTQKQIDRHNAVFRMDKENMVILAMELAELEELINFGTIKIAFIKRMINEYLNANEKETLFESFDHDLHGDNTRDSIIDALMDADTVNGDLLDSLSSQSNLTNEQIEIINREG